MSNKNNKYSINNNKILKQNKQPTYKKRSNKPRIKYNWKIMIFILLFFSSFLLFPQIQKVKAASGNFTEDFSTITYMDPINTNATGWGDGNITLPRKSPEIIGSRNTPGSALEVVVSGDNVFIADDNSGLQIINISDPTDPTIIGATVFSYCRDVVVSGDYAYTANSSQVSSIDISDPANPTIVDSINYGSGFFEENNIFISGDYLYVTRQYWGVNIIDISDPTNIQNITYINIGSDNLSKCWVEGQILFTASHFGSFRSYNLSDPYNPTLIDHQSLGMDNVDLYISGNYAYTAAGGSGLSLVNISDVSNLNTTGSYSTGGYATDIFVSGNFAYILDNTTGLNVINISDPLNPKICGVISAFDKSYGLYKSGDNLFICDGDSGLQIIKIADIKKPNSVGSYNPGGPLDFTYGIDVDGDYAYLTNSKYGLVVMNITDPYNPDMVINLSTPTGLDSDICVSGDFAYLATGNSGSGLEIYNIEDPSNPFLVGTHSAPSSCINVKVSGHYAYIARGSNGLRILNISYPSNPTIVGNEPSLDYTYDIFVSGDTAYLADGTAGLRILDISDPTNPTQIKQYDTNGTAKDVYVSGDYTYVADTGGGLIIFDTSDLSNPIPIGSYQAKTERITVDGNYLYLFKLNFYYWINIINISNPNDPTLLYSTQKSSYISDMEISGDYLYLADYDSFFKVYEIMRNIYRQYEPLATAQSLTIFSGSSSETFLKANLSTIDNKPPGTTITYYLSPDNGSNWEQAIPNTDHYFINNGNQLKWKAILNTSDSLVSPTIYNISIDYEIFLNAPILSSPSNASATNNNTPNFDWEDVPGASSYLIQLDTSKSFNSTDLINATTIISEFIPTSLDEGIWYWRVAANDSEGDLGLFSEIWNIEIDTIPPSSPTLNSPTSGLTINHNITNFDWTSVADVDKYNLQIDTDMGFASIDLVNISTSETNYTSTPLDDGIWYWRVSATDFANNTGSFSIINNLTIDTIPPASPSLSSPGNGSSNNDNTPDFEWNSVGDVDYYNLQIDIVSSFDSINLINISTNNTDYIPAASLNDGIWYWRVMAIDDANNTSPFSTIYILEIDTIKPGTPNLTSPSNDITTNDNNPEFAWTSVLDGDCYNLLIDTSIHFNTTNLINITTNKTNYTPTTSIPDGFWFWRVCAIDDANNTGFYPTPYTITIDTIAPDTPLLFDSPNNNSFIDYNIPNFQWIKLTDHFLFNLQIDTTHTFDSINLINITTSMVYYYPPTSLNDGVWYYRICGIDLANNSSPFTDIINFGIDTISPCLSTNVSDIIYEEGSVGQIINWTFIEVNPSSYNITRNDLLINASSWAGEPIVIDVSGLSEGYYYYNITVVDKAGNKYTDLILVSVTFGGNPIPGFEIITCFLPLMILGLAWIYKKRQKLS